MGIVIEDWLANLGLADYAPQFRSADIDTEVLPHLTDSDLRQLGVEPLGHRRKIMAAVKQQAPHQTLTERRFITVLFCDIVGSTRMSEQLDAETYAELLNLYYQRVERIAKQYGGHVAQFLGDGALVYFGSPVPLEDAAERAALTALKLPEAVRHLDDTLPEIEVRIGIASGLVVIGESTHGDRTAVGQTLNLAARLQALATPGTTVLSEASASLVRAQFDIEGLGQQKIKGVDKPQIIYRLIGQNATLAAAGLHRAFGTGSFVNRLQEQSALHAARPSLGHGCSPVLISGEAGIGKSHLVAEFISSCRQDGAQIRSFAASPLGVTIPFFAFRRPLLLAAQEGDTQAAQITDRLNATDGSTATERRRLRAETFVALSEYLDQKTQELIIVLEDLHWADPSTIQMVETLAEKRPDHRLLLLTSRNADLLDRLPNTAHIPVEPLSHAHTCQIIQDNLGSLDGWDQLIAPLAKRAGGVPIFAEELAGEMRHRQSTGPINDTDIPSSLQQSLQARIDRLGSGRLLLRLVSSVSRVCPLHLLRALWTETVDFDEALADLTSSGLARLLVGSATEPEGLLEIKHQMVRECAYNMILIKDRRAIHRSVVTVLSSDLGKRVNPAILAEQMELADKIEEAATTWAKAGTIAAAQSADAEAVTLYNRALALLSRMDPGKRREEFEIDTILKLYPALIGAKGYVAANRELSDRLNGLIAQETKPEHIMSGLLYQWVGLASQGDILSAHDLLSGVSRDTATGGDEVLGILWDRILGSTLMFIGDLDQAREVLQGIVTRYDPLRHQKPLSVYGATDNYVTILCCLAAMDALENRPDSSGQALSAAEELGHVHTLCHTLAFGVALPAVIRGDWDTAIQAAERLHDKSDDLDLSLWGWISSVIQSVCEANAGDVIEARARFNNAQTALLDRGFSFMMPTFHAVFVREEAKHISIPDSRINTLRNSLETGERWVLPLLRELL